MAPQTPNVSYPLVDMNGTVASSQVSFAAQPTFAPPAQTHISQNYDSQQYDSQKYDSQTQNSFQQPTLHQNQTFDSYQQATSLPPAAPAINQSNMFFQPTTPLKPVVAPVIN